MFSWTKVAGTWSGKEKHEHKEYVLVFAERGADEVLLIEKQKPDWQKNRLNLIGGKVEDIDRKLGANKPEWYACHAAVRELREESGYGASDCKYCGKVVGGHFGYSFAVYVVRMILNSQDPPNPGADEIEKVDWYKWSDVKDSHKLMPNLRVIIPLVRCHMDDWVIEDNGESQKETRHSFTINVKGGLESVNKVR